MAWEISGDVNGIWQGRLLHEEATTGRYGTWLLQNEDRNHPGFTEKLMYKTWGSGEKYLGEGHTPPLPAHDGRLEGVMVMKGCLQCNVGGDFIELRYPQSIELEATTPRTWKLPAGCPSEKITKTRGFAIARHYTQKGAHLFGIGDNYNFGIFDLYVKHHFILRGGMPCESELDWNWLLVEIFKGRSRLKELKNGEEYTIGKGSHIFLPRTFIESTRCDWLCSSGTRIRGVAIYY